MLLGQVDMSVLPSQGDPLCGLTPSLPWSRQGRCDLPFHRPGAWWLRPETAWLRMRKSGISAWPDPGLPTASHLPAALCTSLSWPHWRHPGSGAGLIEGWNQGTDQGTENTLPCLS